MIYVVLFVPEAGKEALIKNLISQCMGNADYSYMCFSYKMDLLDYLNKAHHEKCSVFYYCTDIADGLETADTVRQMNSKYRFNLICPEYDDVEKLFFAGVTYFIEAPFENESICRCIENIKGFYSSKVQRPVLLKCKSGTEVIQTGDIDYVMSDRRKVVFFGGGTERSFYYKLDEIEVMLGNGFLRCHQSFIVNMDKIKCFVHDGLMLEDETFIPISRKKYFEAKKKYLSYVTGNREVV